MLLGAEHLISISTALTPARFATFSQALRVNWRIDAHMHCADLARQHRQAECISIEAAESSSDIEAVTALVSPQAANIERAGFAVLGVIINALDAAGAAACANGLNVTLDAQLVDDIKAVASAVKGGVPVVAAK